MSGQKQEKLKIVDGSLGTLRIYDDNIVFSPPLYRQRYQKVKDKIVSVNGGIFTKVVDIGSGEMKFFRYLLDVPGIQEIILLDKDDQTLKDNVYRINPMLADYLMLRSLPLNVKAVCGDASKYDSVLSGTDVVTMIELIEHMQLSELPELVKCVFQDVKPELVIMTTPNADFNKYIPGFTPGKFRHSDHKFEWTAQEFNHWCQGIVQENKDYSVEFSGCGLGPENTYCTQMAVFLRSSSAEEESIASSMKENLFLNEKDSCFHVHVDCAEVTESLNDRSTSINSSDSYKILSDFDFPVDSRTQDEQDRDYTIARFDSLKHYLISGERSAQSKLDWGAMAENDKSEELTEKGTQDSNSLESHCLKISPVSQDSESSEEDLVFFHVHYVKSENDITLKEMQKNDYIFYIVDNKYAVMPMKSLSKWVNLSADHKIPATIISLTVKQDCFETQGDGDEWYGKVQLWEESDKLSDETVEYVDEDGNEDQETWLADYAPYDDVNELEYDGNKTVHIESDQRTEDRDWDHWDVADDVSPGWD
ncbi:uncharacterized protein Hen1 [Panulirus ornatus]|uniref:uncharacterized protein Hen1 n=1 Tax=Panulirus ornatus TaxID=150431 RepID=UPI003A854A7B